ncbi:MAG: hypothetical protein MZV70_07635 [Desulfobacterales bacterium]|nr:hypothetical protein [Desulfobacterales bacterium]
MRLKWRGFGVQGSGKKQLPGHDRRRPDSYMPEQVYDYGACPRGSLNLLRPESLRDFQP